MGYYEESRSFKCVTCSKTAITKFEHVLECSKCRTSNAKCANCGTKFKSKTGKEHCRVCRRLLGLISPVSMKKSIQLISRSNCSDVREHEKEIKILATKLKWNLLTPLDYYRVANVWMIVTCDELKWSSQEIHTQIELMLDLLVKMLSEPVSNYTKKPSSGFRKSIKQVDSSGRTLKKWPTVKEACEELDLNRTLVTSILNGKKKVSNLDLRWVS
jgi:hypothetical protein